MILVVISFWFNDSAEPIVTTCVKAYSAKLYRWQVNGKLIILTTVIDCIFKNFLCFILLKPFLAINEKELQFAM